MESITLLPKRKLYGSAQDETFMSVLDYSTFFKQQDQYISGNIFQRLEVRNRLKIPCGEDMFD